MYLGNKINGWPKETDITVYELTVAIIIYKIHK